MRIIDQVKNAHDECESFVEFVKLYYSVFAGFCIAMPLLYVVGFITGLLMIKNPFESGKACIDGMF